MEFRITADTRSVTQELAAIGRQAPFAVALAITRTVKEAQVAMQAQMPRAFHLRGTEALFRKAVKVQTASKSRLEGNVRIDGPETVKGQDARISRMILRHEEAGAAHSDAMYRLTDGRMKALGFHLPAKGLRSSAANPPRKLYPRNIGIASRATADGSRIFASSRKGRKVVRGQDQREFSYFVTSRGGVYERRVFGSGSAVRLIWWLRRDVAHQPRLRFFETVELKVDERYRPNLLDAIDEAMQTAKTDARGRLT